jgi:hypothetical protein
VHPVESYRDGGLVVAEGAVSAVLLLLPGLSSRGHFGRDRSTSMRVGRYCRGRGNRAAPSRCPPALTPPQASPPLMEENAGGANGWISEG